MQKLRILGIYLALSACGEANKFQGPNSSSGTLAQEKKIEDKNIAVGSEVDPNLGEKLETKGPAQEMMLDPLKGVWRAVCTEMLTHPANRYFAWTLKADGKQFNLGDIEYSDSNCKTQKVDNFKSGQYTIGKLIPSDKDMYRELDLQYDMDGGNYYTSFIRNSEPENIQLVLTRFSTSPETRSGESYLKFMRMSN